uniref:Uncharacterized protein n=2 Tax=Phlebotomus papatasi TaxID=29031 RepID=A0A1B0DHL4_PHLPP
MDDLGDEFDETENFSHHEDETISQTRIRLQEEEEEFEEEEEVGGDEDRAMVSARPRRMSELNQMPNQTQPIPPASSFFIFSQTNR